MSEVCPKTDESATSKNRSSRDEVVGKVISFEKAKERFGVSQRMFARGTGVPRSTLQGWLSRKASIDAPPALVEFFESPEGLAFLHRLVLAAQIVITLLAPGSIRMVCTFLVLSGLDRFVASSYGYQQNAVAAMERELGSFGEQEKERLGRLMQPKKITIIEDETFHPQVCLVAMEGASGFIVLEMYAQGRDSKTWTKELTAALGDLPIEIVQATSDEAKGLIRHAEQDLDAHHSPDLFHPQQDLVRATSLSMARIVKQARKSVTAAKEFTGRLQWAAEYHEQSEDKGHCSRESVVSNIADAREAEALAQRSLEEAESQQEAMHEARRGITKSYHPFDLQTGAHRTAEKVANELKGHFDNIDRIASWASLSETCLDRIDKARRVMTGLVATVAFFHETIRSWVEELGLTEEIERLVLERWIPGRYLELAAARAQDAEGRSRLRQAAATVIPSVHEIELMLSSCCEKDRLLIAYVVEQCAQLFQRSSSGVEGRNGHLSLFHHGQHRLLERKLKALTVVHNYMKLRADGTTAAERFFGQAPLDVFEWLVERMPLPSWPMKRRRKDAV